MKPPPVENLPQWKMAALLHVRSILKGKNLKEAEDYILNEASPSAPGEYANKITQLLMNDQRFIDMLNGEGEKKPSVQPALERAKWCEGIPRTKGSLSEDREGFLQTLNPKVRKIVANLELKEWLREFEIWLSGTLKQSPPPKGIKAVLFALWEMQEVTSQLRTGNEHVDLGLFGTQRYRGANKDSDWYEWEPKIYFSDFSGTKGLSKKIERAGEEPWSVYLGLILIVVKAYFSDQRAKFEKASGLKKPRIFVGFVDGDLIEIFG